MTTQDGELVTPNLFLATAKEGKVYNEITHMIVKQALNDFRDLPYAFSLNISMVDIENKETKLFLFEQVKNFPEPSRLVFELLETEEIKSYKNLQSFIQTMHSLGAKIAIDDFGSGYSNFNYLAKLNVDYVKIDGSLISEIHSSFASKTIVEMISSFANQMGMKTIAEFVSTQEIADMVKSLKLDESQGYHYGKPLPFSEVLQKLQVS